MNEVIIQDMILATDNLTIPEREILLTIRRKNLFGRTSLRL
ncbi:hypothetical protein AAFM79_15680 [Trichormus azollae HNT15244]